VSTLEPGSQLPALSVTPDRYATVRYAGASGDFNPIHIDEDYAKSVGLPGRILHGLYTMALLARAETGVAGGPGKLKRLAVQFRGPALPEEEITITSTVKEQRENRAIVTVTATQRGKAVIRGATAEIEL
jgi:acyl dehydratase